MIIASAKKLLVIVLLLSCSAAWVFAGCTGNRVADMGANQFRSDGDKRIAAQDRGFSLRGIPVTFFGQHRSSRVATIDQGNLLLPQGKLTNAVGGLFASAMKPLRVDVANLVEMIESASVWDDDALPFAEQMAVVYLEVTLNTGRRSVLDVRFGIGDTMQVGTYCSYGGKCDPDFDEDQNFVLLGAITDVELAQNLRKSIDFASVSRNDLTDVQSVSAHNFDNTEAVLLTTEEAAILNHLISSAELETEDLNSRLDYDCYFDLALTDGSEKTVILSSAGVIGIGRATYALKLSDRDIYDDYSSLLQSLNFDNPLGMDSPLAQYRM